MTDSVIKELDTKIVRQIANRIDRQQIPFARYLDTICIPFMIFLSYNSYPGEIPEDGKNIIFETRRKGRSLEGPFPTLNRRSTL